MDENFCLTISRQPSFKSGVLIYFDHLLNIKKVSSEMYSVGDLNVELLKTKSFGVIDEYKIVSFLV